jgi:hypothetical protein
LAPHTTFTVARANRAKPIPVEPAASAALYLLGHRLAGFMESAEVVGVLDEIFAPHA